MGRFLISNYQSIAQKIYFKKTSSKVIIWLFLGIVATFSVVFSHGLSTEHFGTPLLNSPQKMRELFGPSDAGSYLNAALQLDAISKIAPDNYWVFSLWPPGMPVLDAAILRLIPNDLWFGVILGATVATLWGLFLGYLAYLTYKKFNIWLGLFFLLFSVGIGPIHDWILDFGIFYSESFSTLFFFFGLTLVIKFFRSDARVENLILPATISGVTFAAAAYFRAAFFNIYYWLVLVAVLAGTSLIIRCISRVIRNAKPEKEKRFNKIKILIFSGVAAISMHVTMNPWMGYLEKTINGTGQWSTVGGAFIAGIWTERESHPGFIQEGGVGWGCKIDPVKCNQIQIAQQNPDTVLNTKKLFKEAVLSAAAHPIEYLQDRIKFNGLAFFSSEYSGVGKNTNIPYGLAILGAFGYVVRLMLQNRIFLFSSTLLVLPLLFIVFAPGLIGHVEVRYLITTKLIFLLLPSIFNEIK